MSQNVEHVVKFEAAFSNVFIAKSVTDGIIWKLNNMAEWLSERMKSDEAAIQKMVDADLTDDDNFAKKVSIFSQNEDSLRELKAQHGKLAEFYRATYGEPAPSTLPKEQKPGYMSPNAAKAYAERWTKKKAA